MMLGSKVLRYGVPIFLSANTDRNETFDLFRNSSIASFPRRWEFSPVLTSWIPVCTGMTNKDLKNVHALHEI